MAEKFTLPPEKERAKIQFFKKQLDDLIMLGTDSESDLYYLGLVMASGAATIIKNVIGPEGVEHAFNSLINDMHESLG